MDNEENRLPERKKLRLVNYDYSTSGAYFITICTKDRKMLFGTAGEASYAKMIIEKSYLDIINSNDGIDSPIYVIMPNHFHAVITIKRADTRSAPTISDIVRSFKSKSTLEYIKAVEEKRALPFEKQLWQRSFYDHVIRNPDEYNEICKYIFENPQNWEHDELNTN